MPIYHLYLAQGRPQASTRRGRDFVWNKTFSGIIDKSQKNKKINKKDTEKKVKKLFEFWKFCFFINVPFAKEEVGNKCLTVFPGGGGRPST